MNSSICDTKTSMIPSYKEDKYEMLRNLPENDTMYKCSHCRYIFDIRHGGQANILTILRTRSWVFCPRCGEKDPGLMCKVDGYSIILKIQGKNCRKGEVMSGTDLCPVCNRSVCPNYWNHDVVSLSRVTGYVQSVDGWNNGKKQELKDRQRYAIMT